MVRIFQGRLEQEIQATYKTLQRFNPTDEIYLNFTSIFLSDVCEYYFKPRQDEATQIPCSEDSLLNSGLDTILTFVLESARTNIGLVGNIPNSEIFNRELFAQAEWKFFESSNVTEHLTVMLKTEIGNFTR